MEGVCGLGRKMARREAEDAERRRTQRKFFLKEEEDGTQRTQRRFFLNEEEDGTQRGRGRREDFF